MSFTASPFQTLETSQLARGDSSSGIIMTIHPSNNGDSKCQETHLGMRSSGRATTQQREGIRNAMIGLLLYSDISFLRG